ncbi:MAG TPA: hypothetical protein VG650_03870 [Mycobacteriales bacterium]|nr:hypothetical protein [Mycobacteriales bacterium]
MKRTTLALGAAASIAVAGLATPIASASAGLHGTVKPAKPAVGQTVKVHVTGAAKNHSYYCLLAIGHAGVMGGASLADTGTLQTVKSNRSGVVSCTQIFLTFPGSYQGKSHQCPPTKADKKHGWYCGVGIANVTNHKQFVIAKFNF